MLERYPEYEYYFAFAQLAFAMLGMGATLSIQDFVDVFRAPRGLVLGLVTQLVAVPLLALAIGRVLGLEAGLAVGLILLAAVPGGSLSNVAAYLARANYTLTISLTVLTTVGCLITAPLVLRAFAAEHLPASFAMPVDRIALEIFGALLVPLVLGMGIGKRLGERRVRFTRRCITASLLVIAAMIVGAAGSGRVDPGSYGATALLALFLLAAGVYVAGIGLARLAGLPRGDAVAIGIEVTIRNTNLALLLKASLFPVVAGVADPLADQVFFMALLYGGVALPFATLPILRHRRRTKPTAPQVAELASTPVAALPRVGGM